MDRIATKGEAAKAACRSCIVRGFALVLAIGLPGSLSTGFAEAIERAAPRVTAPAIFQRIVLLGASGTAGFEKSEPFGGPKTHQYRFAYFVEAVSTGARDPVATEAATLLFLQAEETMTRQVTATVAARPSLVVGLDALFWFCYGAGLTPGQRVTRFEVGLRQLERIEAPLVIADLPDATSAVGKILSPGQVPAPAVIGACNQRLKEWAAARKNVVVFPLASLMAGALANREMTFAGHAWKEGTSADLIRPDRLHPSQKGLAALAIAMLDAAATAFSPEASGSLNRDLHVVLAAGVAKSRPVRGDAPK